MESESINFTEEDHWVAQGEKFENGAPPTAVELLLTKIRFLEVH
jgi:hypothetical protein